MKSIAAVAALAALTLPAVAQARADLSPESTQAAVRYALPHLLAGIRSSCGPKLAPNGYLARNGAALLDRYSQGSEAAWPAARGALMALGGEKNADMAQMLGQMPDAALKPFVDATISSMIATKLKVDDCDEIERGLELLAPLPPENIAGLAGFLFEMADRDKKAKVGQGG
jgi:hypothetical protein